MFLIVNPIVLSDETPKPQLLADDSDLEEKPKELVDVVNEYIEELKKMHLDTPDNIDVIRKLYLAYLSTNDVVQANVFFNKLKKENYKEIDEIMNFYINHILGTIGKNGKPIAQKIIVDLIDRYKPSKDKTFSIKKILFVKDMDKIVFGQYDKLESNSFSVGERIAIYVELENFKVYEEKDEKFNVRVTGGWKVLSDLGARMDSRENYYDYNVNSKSIVKDVCMLLYFKIPEDLPKNKSYFLQIKMQDENEKNQASDKKQLVFQIK